MIFEKNKTAVDTINGLSQKGYDCSFDWENGKMRCLENGKTYDQNEMKIDEQHRFEGMSNPSDSSIVFAISCADNTKGIIVSAYGIYANAELLNFMNQLTMNKEP